MIRELHHIGIAVTSIEEALPHYVDGLGLRLHSIEEVPTEQVRVAVVMAGDDRLELLQPTSESSPIAAFLARRGPGIHHLAFRVDSTGETMKVLLERGAPLLADVPRPGAHGTQVAFVHPRYLGGVLAELVEVPR